VKLINLDEGDKVVDVARVAKSEEGNNKEQDKTETGTETESN
jgi:hypothetical protein